MQGLLKEKAAVITGAASGNGRMIARRFAEHGADVIVADVRKEPREGGTPTHDLVNSKTDQQAKFIECDVSNVDDLEAAVGAADEFGGIDCLVNNAAIFRSEEFTDVTEEEYDRLMEINLKGTFFGAQAAAIRLKETGGGTIINLSSIAGLRGQAPIVTYCASKGGIRLMTYALAAKLGPEGIRVNAIHPGVIETKMTTEDFPMLESEGSEELIEGIPSRRAGQPEDVADAALYLASDLSEYVNGESHTVDGGLANTV